MAKGKRYYDTSKYISLPVALLVVVVVLIVLVTMGMKYSIFTGGLLSAKVAPSPGLAQCVKEHQDCIADATKAYNKCTNDAQIALQQCYASITETDPIIRASKRAQCELDAATDVSNCTVDFSTDISRCAPAMKECVEKYNKAQGITPTPIPGAPGQTNPKGPTPLPIKRTR